VVSRPDQNRRGGVALVLAGGGARGAYEIGALSALLPVLKERGEYPDIVIGTSVGALNAAWFAATADEAADALPDVLDGGCQIWREIDYAKVLRPLASPRQLATFARAGLDMIGVPGPRFWSIFDPAPLAKTLRDLQLVPRIRRNVRNRSIRTAAVVTTSAATGRTVVFHDGGGRISRDRWRSIDYVGTPLGVEHLRASAAIPAAFPAVHIRAPARARGWYFDGGTRLNTPIKPAIALGAEKVIVVALNSPPDGRHATDPRRRADGFDGLSQVMEAVLVDPLVNDMKTLTTVNEAVGEAGGRGRRPASKRRRIEYIFIAPEPYAIGQCASDIYKRDYALPPGALHSSSLAMLGHTLDAGKSAIRGELFSYLFFAPEFANALIQLGRDDARSWLRRAHDDGPWRWRRPPLGPR
jgi:NTE family protein